MSNWTTTEIQTLRDLWALGLSTNEIGRRTGRSKNSIIGAAHRAGLPARPSPIRGRTTQPKAFPAGKITLPALASDTTPVRPEAWRTTTDADEARIRTMQMNGSGYKWIAERTGFSMDVVRRVLGTRPERAGVLVVYAPAPSKPLPVSLVPFPRVPDAPRPISSGSCAWPMWAHTERPKFSADGLPMLCGGARSHGSYCLVHGRTAYARKAEAA
jgi:GcrA cell cycle regulator